MPKRDKTLRSVSVLLGPDDVVRVREVSSYLEETAQVSEFASISDCLRYGLRLAAAKAKQHAALGTIDNERSTPSEH